MKPKFNENPTTPRKRRDPYVRMPKVVATPETSVTMDSSFRQVTQRFIPGVYLHEPWQSTGGQSALLCTRTPLETAQDMYWQMMNRYASVPKDFAATLLDTYQRGVLNGALAVLKALSEGKNNIGLPGWPDTGIRSVDLYPEGDA